METPSASATAAAEKEAQLKMDIASAMQKAEEAEKEAAKLEAEGIRAKLEAEAAGIKAKLEAEAAGIRAKSLAEAEGIEKKAEAQKKMGEASIVEMIMNALPQVAKEVSAPLANVDNITMYGDQSTKLIENNNKYKVVYTKNINCNCFYNCITLNINKRCSVIKICSGCIRNRIRT